MRLNNRFVRLLVIAIILLLLFILTWHLAKITSNANTVTGNAVSSPGYLFDDFQDGDYSDAWEVTSNIAVEESAGKFPYGAITFGDGIVYTKQKFTPPYNFEWTAEEISADYHSFVLGINEGFSEDSILFVIAKSSGWIIPYRYSGGAWQNQGGKFLGESIQGGDSFIVRVDEARTRVDIIKDNQGQPRATFNLGWELPIGSVGFRDFYPNEAGSVDNVEVSELSEDDYNCPITISDFYDSSFRPTYYHFRKEINDPGVLPFLEKMALNMNSLEREIEYCTDYRLPNPDYGEWRCLRYIPEGIAKTDTFKELKDNPDCQAERDLLRSTMYNKFRTYSLDRDMYLKDMPRISPIFHLISSITETGHNSVLGPAPSSPDYHGALHPSRISNDVLGMNIKETTTSSTEPSARRFVERLMRSRAEATSSQKNAFKYGWEESRGDSMWSSAYFPLQGQSTSSYHISWDAIILLLRVHEAYGDSFFNEIPTGYSKSLRDEVNFCEKLSEFKDELDRAYEYVESNYKPYKPNGRSCSDSSTDSRIDPSQEESCLQVTYVDRSWHDFYFGDSPGISGARNSLVEQFKNVCPGLSGAQEGPGTYQFDATVVLDKQENLHLFYDDYDYQRNSGAAIYHEKSTDGGQTWTLQEYNPINSLTDWWTARYDPKAIVLDNGDIVLTYAMADCRGDPGTKTISTVSTDNGLTWEGPYDIKTFAGNGDCQNNVLQGVGDDQTLTQLSDGSLLEMSLHLQNNQYPNPGSFSNKGVYSTRSTNGGRTWTDSILYDESYFDVPNTHQAAPIVGDFAYDPITENLYLSFSGYLDSASDSDPYSARSSDNGITWTFNDPSRIRPRSATNEGAVLFDRGDRIYAVVEAGNFVTKEIDLILSIKSKSGDDSWTNIATIVNDIPNCGNVNNPDYDGREVCAGVAPVPIVFSDGTTKVFYQSYEDGINFKTYSVDITSHLEPLPDPQICGDNLINGDEECDDGNNFDGDFCSSTCELTVCGDGIIQSPSGQGIQEICDGAELDGKSCTTQGFDKGALACSPTCTEFNTAQCEFACDITSASWSTASTIEGTQVTLIVEGQNCNGEEISFEVLEDDLIGDDIIQSNPTTAEFVGDTAITSWIAEWQCDAFCLGNPEYYFKAKLIGDESIKITSSPPKLTVTELSPECGNGLVQEGEECDDGNDIDFDGCTNSCTITVCGDGLIQEPNGEGVQEICDSNSITCTTSDSYNGNSACNSNCLGYENCIPEELCGDGLLNGNEACDNGINNGQPNQCNLACTGITDSICGNSFIEGVEECDDGNLINSDTCTSQCILTVCGDGVIQTPNGNNINEACDDGALNGQPNKCNTECTGITSPGCGNGIKESGEACDDGDGNNQNSCTNSCVFAVCGDGVTHIGVESCDSGTNGSPLCTSTCEFTICGDGIIQSPNGEGVQEFCDGDSTLCTTPNSGYSGGSQCESTCLSYGECVTEEYCGDNTKNGNEECDDGNNFDGDGCSASCEIEIDLGEICSNEIDDDDDGLIDCSDPECADDESCILECVGVETRECLTGDSCHGTQVCSENEFGTCVLNTEICAPEETEECDAVIKGSACSTIKGIRTCDSCGAGFSICASETAICCPGDKQSCTKDGSDGEQTCNSDGAWKDCEIISTSTTSSPPPSSGGGGGGGSSSSRRSSDSNTGTGTDSSSASSDSSSSGSSSGSSPGSSGGSSDKVDTEETQFTETLTNFIRSKTIDFGKQSTPEKIIDVTVIVIVILIIFVLLSVRVILRRNAASELIKRHSLS